MPRLFLPMEHTTERGVGRRVAHPPHSLPPLFHSEFSFLENRAETLPLPLPLILKLQIERDIRVLFRRMSRWKRSRRDSRPQHPPPPRYYPRLSSDSTNPRQGSKPNPTPRIRRVTRQPGWAHAAFPLPHSTPIRVSFIPINIPLAAFFAPLSAIISLSYVSPPASLLLLLLLLLPYFALIRVSPLPSPTRRQPSLPPSPFPFLCNLSAAFVSLFTPLLPLPETAAAPAAVATLPLFLSRASNKREFEELAYRRNSEGKYFLEIS